MYTGKRYSIGRMLRWSLRYIIMFIIFDSLVVGAHELFDLRWLMVPWQPISLIGIAVAFYLGFKNNSSYERLWEGRKIWGGIVNASRSFTVMTRDFVSDYFAEEKVDEEELKKIHKTIVHRHVAWLLALTFQLRQKREWEHHQEKIDWLRIMGDVEPDKNHFPKMKTYLSAEDYDYVISKGNKASHLLSLQSKEFKELRKKRLIDDFRHMELEKMIAEFYTLQGKSERIKNFPFPRQYASVNFFFVWMFIGLIPFAMLSIFSQITFEHFVWVTIPISVLVSWVFIIMEMIGDYSENPFEGLFNDVPISTISRGIEIDIRQMLEETDLPGPLRPISEFKIQL